MGSYVPDRGDVVWLSFSPQAGHEQAGRRPALTISPRIYNEKAGLALFCSLTSKIKGYPFEVEIPAGMDLAGVILADQIMSLDWEARSVEHAFALPEAVVSDVLGKIRTLVS